MKAFRKLYHSSVTFLLCVAIGYLIGLEFKSVQGLNTIALVVGIPTLFFLAVLVHELGHLWAGRLLGHTLVYLQVLFLVWLKGTPVAKPLWIMPRNSWGLCGTLPPYPHQMSRVETAVFAVAGPLANLLCAGVLFALAAGLFSEGSTGSVLVRIGCWLNLGSALFNLVPSFADKDTDGDLIWATLGLERFNRSQSFSAQRARLLMAGVRPRDLPANSPAPARELKAGDLLIDYYCALDRGERSQAEEIMARLEAMYPKLTSLEQQAVGAELLFWFCLRFREDRARQWRHLVKVPLDDSSSGLRIIAYAHWYLDQDPRMAREYAQRLGALKVPNVAPGLVPLDQDLVEQLCQQITTTTV